MTKAKILNFNLVLSGSIAKGEASSSPENMSITVSPAQRIAALSLTASKNAARKRQIDLILVWKLDRFGRSLKQLVMALDELSSLG